jgi:hypothetical protein
VNDGPRLPRALDDDPRTPSLRRRLAASAEPLWSGGSGSASRVAVGERLAASLRSLLHTGFVSRGLEQATERLAAEERGLAMAPDAVRPAPGSTPRISRLVLVSDDGSERFYRGVDSLLRRHGPRLFVLRLAVDADTLGSLVFGPGRSARLVLLEHKDAVAGLLFALAAQWESDPTGGGPLAGPPPSS